MTRPKRKEIMGRTIVVIDEDTKKLWTRAAIKQKKSNSEFVRMLIKEHAPNYLTAKENSK